MGNRANIKVIAGSHDPMYFYTHWQGDEGVDRTVIVGCCRAVKEGRADDEQYFARILFCTHVESDPQGSTGFGLGTSICEEGSPMAVVDMNNGVVTLTDGTQMTVTEAAERGAQRLAWERGVEAH